VNRIVFQRLGLGGTIAVPKPREVADLVLTACTGLFTPNGKDIGDFQSVVDLWISGTLV
jgi:hypothetical protein